MKRFACPAMYAAALFVGTCLVTACGGGGKSVTSPDTCIGKGALAPPPVFLLDYPPNGSSNIPTNAGILIEIGAEGAYANAIISMSSVSGSVPLGAPTAVPSPLPTPFATPSPNSVQGPYVAIPMPTLSPNTTYTVAAQYMAFADNPPSCIAPTSQTMGTFTTGH